MVTFSLGMFLLAFFDAWLPSGDSIAMGSALAVGAILQFDTLTVLIMLTASELLARVSQRRPGWMWRAARELAQRSVAVVIASSLLLALSLHPSARPVAELPPTAYVYFLIVGLLFAAIEFALGQAEAGVRMHKPLASWMLGSMELGGWLIAAQASVGVLSFVMYQSMVGWGLVVAIVLVLVMRQSFVLLLQVRQAYNSTVDVLIQTMEAQRPGRLATAERVADACIDVGRMVGLHGRDLERLRYAALLYDVGLSEGDDEDGSGDASNRFSSRVVSGVSFLSDVAPVLEVCETGECDGAPPHVLLSAYIVAATLDCFEDCSEGQRAKIRTALQPQVASQVDEAAHRAFRSLVPCNPPKVVEG